MKRKWVKWDRVYFFRPEIKNGKFCLIFIRVASVRDDQITEDFGHWWINYIHDGNKGIAAHNFAELCTYEANVD